MSSDLQLIQAFEKLSASLFSLHQQLKSDAPHFWLLQPDDKPASLDQLLFSICNIWYQEKGDGRCTQNSYGLAGVSRQMIPLIHQVNQHKTQFQKCVSQYRQQQQNPSELLHKRAQALSESLQLSGLARLHLKQCYRHIPVLDTCPDKIGFSWYSSGRSIKKISAADAEKKLLKMDYSQLHIQRQLEALAYIPQSEILAQLQPQVPVMRANIRWRQGDSYQRIARNCPLPIFFPLDDSQAFPEYNQPSFEPPEQRQRQLRSDLVIEPDPFLPSLRVHRYKSP